MGRSARKRPDRSIELEKVRDRHSAVRVRLLIVHHELDEYRDGNIKESHPVSVDCISIETAHRQ